MEQPFLSLFGYELALADLSVLLIVALFIGMAKTGVHGAGLVAVPLLAAVFGGKASSGLLLPILIMADVFGVTYYHRHASWPHLVKLFPWAALGILAGTFFGNYISDALFTVVMAVIVFLSVSVMLWLERNNQFKIPDFYWFAALMGILAGFTTMVGNLAGPIAALYLLSMHLPKNAYIGTSAWFFFCMNCFKVPFHVFVWKTIDLDSTMLGLVTLPIIGFGAWLGIKIIRRIPEKPYRIFIIVTTLLAALVMLI